MLSPCEGVVPEYLGLTLQSDPFINRVTANSIGIAYPAIAETRLGTFHVAMPPDTGEQRAIVEQVRDETATLTTWIERTQREIDLIREYRMRLIADVVTGKLDVRHLALPPSDEQIEPEDLIEDIEGDEPQPDDDPEPVEEADEL